MENDEEGKALWKLASIYLKRREAPPHYPYRKVWREGLEVAIKIALVSGAKASCLGQTHASVYSNQCYL